jgi:hypothetical protein
MQQHPPLFKKILVAAKGTMSYSAQLKQLLKTYSSMKLDANDEEKLSLSTDTTDMFISFKLETSWAREYA